VNADVAIDMLDRSLARDGEDIVLRRVYGTAPAQTSKDVSVRALVRAFSAEEIASGIAQTDSKVILSPTEITTAGWPQGEAPSATVSIPSLPRANDKCVIAGRVRNVLAPVRPFFIGSSLVRIELRVAG
jgi:hypothetical protein